MLRYITLVVGALGILAPSSAALVKKRTPPHRPVSNRAAALLKNEEHQIVQSDNQKSRYKVDNRNPGLFYIADNQDPTIVFNFSSGSCKNQIIVELADSRSKEFITNMGYACDGKLRQFRHSSYRFVPVNQLIETLKSGSAIYRMRQPSDEGGAVIQDWQPFPRSTEVRSFHLTSEQFTALDEGSAAQQLAARTPSPDSAAVRRAILQSISKAPQLAGGRALGMVKTTQDAVTLDMMATTYQFEADTRNVKCMPNRAGRTCSYESNVSVALTALGNQMFRVESGWLKRNDVFRSVNGKLVSSDLDAYTARIASTIGGGRSTSASNEPSAGEKCRDRMLDILQNQGMGAAASASFCP